MAENLIGINKIIELANSEYESNGGKRNAELAALEDKLCEKYDVDDLCTYGTHVASADMLKLATAISVKFKQYVDSIVYKYERTDTDEMREAYFINSMLDFASKTNKEAFNIIQDPLLNFCKNIHRHNWNLLEPILSRLIKIPYSDLKEIENLACWNKCRNAMHELLFNDNIQSDKKRLLIAHLGGWDSSKKNVYDYYKKDANLVTEVILEHGDVVDLIELCNLSKSPEIYARAEGKVINSEGDYADAVIKFMINYGTKYDQLQQRLKTVSISDGRYCSSNIPKVGLYIIKEFAASTNDRPCTACNFEYFGDKYRNFAEHVNLDILDDVVAGWGYYDLIYDYAKSITKTNIEKMQKAFIESDEYFVKYGEGNKSKAIYIEKFMKIKGTDKNLLFEDLLKHLDAARYDTLLKVASTYEEFVPQLQEYLLTHDWVKKCNNEYVDYAPTYMSDFAKNVKGADVQKINNLLKSKYPNSEEGKALINAEKEQERAQRENSIKSVKSLLGKI